MLSIFYAFIFQYRDFVRGAVVFIWQACCAALLIGVVSTAATTIMEVSTRRLAGRETNVSLEQLLPGWPTWWIPESAAGFGAYLLLMLAVYMLHDLTKQVDRLVSH